jgi:pSer/pThr/pTyr-binding forkhead associated (FHA) protein
MTTLAAQHPFDFADEGTVSEAPTQTGGDLPRISQRDHQRAELTGEHLAPGRYLAIEDGSEVVVIAIGEGSLRFGRGIASDVVLEDRSVSRRHAVVTRTGADVVLWDDRSLNGVRVNGARVAQSALQHGDVVARGEVQMRFVAVD